jgi:hypothetical protein
LGPRDVVTSSLSPEKQPNAYGKSHDECDSANRATHNYWNMGRQRARNGSAPLLTKPRRVRYHLEAEPGFEIGGNVTTASPEDVDAVVWMAGKLVCIAVIEVEIDVPATKVPGGGVT